MNIKIKVKTFIRRNFYKPLEREQLLKYRNILKLLYHPEGETPLIDPKIKGKYFIQVPSINLYLIVEKGKTEIINTKQIYPLDLCDEVYDRAVSKILEETSKQRYTLEVKLKNKKQSILEKVYNTIK